MSSAKGTTTIHSVGKVTPVLFKAHSGLGSKEKVAVVFWDTEGFHSLFSVS